MVKHIPLQKMICLGSKEQFKALKGKAIFHIPTDKLNLATPLQKIANVIKAVAMFVFAIIASIPMLLSALSVLICSKKTSKKILNELKYDFTLLPRTLKAI
jgi:hypothetical protein